jgi:hypothetical protein
MSNDLDPVAQEFLERVRRERKQEAKSKHEWSLQHNLLWLAEHCDEIRQLLIDHLTAEHAGWTWKKNDDAVSEERRKFRFKSIEYPIGPTKIEFHIAAYGRGHPAKHVSVGIDERWWITDHLCEPGEHNLDRNVRTIVAMVMVVLVSKFTGSDNQKYFY